jgi:hypothetical protein
MKFRHFLQGTSTILYTALFLIVFSACTRHKSNVMKLSENDTIITLNLKGKSEKLIVRKTTYHMISDIQSVINKYYDNLEYTSNITGDITGEGISDEAETTIRKKGDGFLVTNTIRQNDSIIWMDTLSVDNKISYYWDPDSTAFFQIKPYSQFYIALRYFSNFVGPKFDTTNEFYLDNKTVIHDYIGYDKNPEYWEKYLSGFKGNIIYNLSYEDGGVYMWDKRIRKFILIYEP